MSSRRLLVVWLLLGGAWVGPSGATSMTSATAPADLSRKCLGDVFPLTQRYLEYWSGNPTPDHQHAGVDYGAVKDAAGRITKKIEGRTVKAAKAGEVIYVGRGNAANGTTSIVCLYDGQNTVIYLHMTDIAVDANRSVIAGAVLGKVGSVGATAAHLHVEVRRGRKTAAVGLATSGTTAANTIDPFYYLLP